jgi:RNA polymerase sigma-70 factor (ECF subfamily)
MILNTSRVALACGRAAARQWGKQAGRGPMSDSRLVETFREHEHDLVLFLAARLKSLILAQDLAQELYLKLSQFEDGEAISNKRAYLFRMAANLAIDHLRGESRRAALLAEAQSFLGTRNAVATPEQELIARDQLARLERAMAEMPPLSRRIFYLSRFEEKSQREIAEIVGLSPTAVFKHIRKVLDHLASVRDA